MSVFKFKDYDWSPLTASDTILNKEKKIICGKISSTPYLVSGFSPTPSSKLALISLIDANNSIYTAKNQGADVTDPLSILDSGWSSYYSCQYSLAKSLADRAKEALVGIPYLLLFILMGLLAGLWYYYSRVKRKVKIKRKIYSK